VICRLFVVPSKSFFRSRPNALRWLACGILIWVFLWNAAQFYLPGKGFTFLIEFGEREHARYLPELRAINHDELPNSSGYDSQYYAQIAMRPRLGDPVLAKAVDSLPYRARRILFCWTAWAIAAGHPVLALNVYAVQNIACWVLLALLLLRWLPPTTWGNVGRWSGVLFSFGMAHSVRGALTDGPSLLLIASGIALLEKGRPWLGSVVLGVAGLGRETNVLAGSTLEWPSGRDVGSWARTAVRAALVILPLAFWLLCLRLWLGRAGDVGARNITLPFAGLLRKCNDTLAQLWVDGWPVPASSVSKFDVLVLIGLIAQFLFFALRPRWRDRWWRMGAAYAVLMVVLGDAVWEGYPSAAARVLLPMTLAFNLLVPRGRAWIWVILAGNLGVVGSFDVLKPPGRDGFQVSGPRALRVEASDGRTVEATYLPGNWYPPVEKSRLEYWFWSKGTASIAIRNPHPYPVLADISLGVRSNDARSAGLTVDGRALWRGMLVPGVTSPVDLPGTVLSPGVTLLRFDSDRAASYRGSGDMRPLAFSVRNLKIVLKGRVERTAPPTAVQKPVTDSSLRR